MTSKELDLSKIRGLPPHKGNLEEYYNYVVAEVGRDLLRGKKPVIVFIGPPGSGKSSLLEVLDSRLRTSYPGVMQYSARRVTLEKDGRDPAIASGLIDPSKPRTVEDIEKISSLVAPAMIEAIKDPGVNLVLAELPYVTQLKVGDHLVGTNAGTSALDQVLEPNNPYNLPEHDDFVIFPVAGQSLRRETEEYRREIKDAKTFEDQILIAIKYGKTIPQTAEEGMKMARDGAAPSAMELYRKMIQDLLSDPATRKVRRHLSREGRNMVRLLVTRYQDTSTNKISLLATQRREEAIAHYLRTNTFRNLQPNHFYVAINEPSQSELRGVEA